MSSGKFNALAWGLWLEQAQAQVPVQDKLREGRDFTTQTDAPNNPCIIRVQPLEKLECWLLQIAIGDQQMCGEAGHLASDDWMRLPWWRVELWREGHMGIIQ